MSEEKVSGVARENAEKEVPGAEQVSAAESFTVFPAPEKEAAAEGGPERGAGRYDEILAKVSAPSAAALHADDAVASDARSIGTGADEEGAIQKLLDLAQTKGVVHAVSVACTLDDYYALDRMHDALADKLYAGLLARGLITKE